MKNRARHLLHGSTSSFHLTGFGRKIFASCIGNLFLRSFLFIWTQLIFILSVCLCNIFILISSFICNLLLLVIKLLNGQTGQTILKFNFYSNINKIVLVERRIKSVRIISENATISNYLNQCWLVSRVKYLHIKILVVRKHIISRRCFGHNHLIANLVWQ